jgi:hypothetical protein
MASHLHRYSFTDLKIWSKLVEGHVEAIEYCPIMNIFELIVEFAVS